MRVARLTAELGQLRAALVVVPISAAVQKDPKSSKAPIFALDQILGGSFFDELEAAGFKADGKEPHMIVRVGGAGRQRLVILAVPFEHKQDPFSRVMAYRGIGESAAACAKAKKLSRIVVVGNDIDLADAANLAAMVEAVALANYSFTECLSTKPDQFAVESLQLWGADDFNQQAADNALATAEGIMLSRTLSLLPPNRKHPLDYAVRAKEALADFGDVLKVEVIDQQRLEDIGAGGILGVNRGSDFPACVLKIVYDPEQAAGDPPIALIGKGVVFDTGGYSLKPPAAQPDMKGDCGGGNTVVGAMKAIAAIGVKRRIVAYVPLVENRINGSAIVPSDVLTSLSGRTVEVLNTDAEGRLILMDVLTMAQGDGCKTLVDLATLTGACMVALGNTCAGVFSNDDELCAALLAAAETAGDRMWRMPLLPELDEELKSGVADFANIGTDRMGGAIHAALFLQRFVEDARWVHCDVAGPGTNQIKDRQKFRGGPVGTLVNLALALAN